MNFMSKNFPGTPPVGFQRSTGEHTALLHYTDSTLNGDGIHPTCLSYLKNLGVTYVQLMPVFDYGSVDERKKDAFNWGYDPVKL